MTQKQQFRMSSTRHSVIMYHCFQIQTESSGFSISKMCLRIKWHYAILTWRWRPVIFVPQFDEIFLLKNECIITKFNLTLKPLFQWCSLYFIMIEPCWRIVSLAGWLHKALPIPTGIPAFLMRLTWESSASQQRQLGTPKDKLREWTTNVVTVWATVIILFETTVSALDSAQASLTPQLFWHLRVLCVRTQGFRRENGAWSRIQSRGF